jgi:FtsP/CotA-like multicopper oxidase with cupredoxin domain
MRIGLLILTVLLGVSAAPAQAPAGPTEIFSANGVLSATLSAAEGKIHVGALELDGATYNGDYAGPVLHVHPGDLMRIRLVNHLSLPTNLHFHGIRTSPLGNGDNAHLVVRPGQTFDYAVRISPAQPAGLFWYHAHLHGLAEHQVMGGLSGTIVVEPPTRLPTAQRLFVLKDMVFDDDTGNGEIDDTLHGIVQSVNGQPTVNAAMRPGETQLWRFSNQSADRVVHLALDAHRFRIVAEDGAPRIAERSTDVLDIQPAARVDVLVDAGAAGRYALRAKGIMTGTGAALLPDRVIGTLDVAGDPQPRSAALPSTPPPPDLRTTRIDARREIVFSQTVESEQAAQRFFINGKVFDAARIDTRVQLGTIEEWTIRNDSDDLHVFHIHQIGFQVVEIDDKPVPFTGYVDTVRVPERGQVKLRLPFTDPGILGRFVYHWHVLKHEDAGMMANIEVYDPAPSALSARLNRLYQHIWWWWHGVPWSLCGLADA